MGSLDGAIGRTLNTSASSHARSASALGIRLNSPAFRQELGQSLSLQSLSSLHTRYFLEQDVFTPHLPRRCFHLGADFRASAAPPLQCRCREVMILAALPKTCEVWNGTWGV